MNCKIEDLRDMPIMFDKVVMFLYSKILQRPYNDPFYKDINLNKADLTKNTRNFIGRNETVVGRGNKMKYVYDSIENVQKSGRPRFTFKEDIWKGCFINRVYFQGYDRFVIKVIGNPLRYQRLMYSENGFMDNDLDDKYRLHDNNYLYPVLIGSKKSNIELQKENLKFFPVVNKLGEFVTKDVLDCSNLGSVGYYLESIGDYDNLIAIQNSPEERESLKDMMDGGIYRSKSCQYIEVNQDLLLPDPNAQQVMRGIVEFFMSEKGRLYSSKIGVHKIRAFDNREYDGVQLMLELEKGYGKYKIYCKTKYSIRREICLYSEDLVKKFGNKKLTNIYGVGYNDFIKNVIVLALGTIDLKEIICKKISVKSSILNSIISYSRMPMIEKHFWRKGMNGTLFNKEDIPKYLRKFIRMRWVYDRRLKRSKRMYELKPEIRGELIEFR